MGEEKNQQKHQLWIKEEFEEGEREKRKAAQFYKSKISRTGFNIKAKMEGKMTHGVEGRRGRAGRGNKR